MGLYTKIFTVALIGCIFLISSLTLFSDLDSTYDANKSEEFKDHYKALNITAFDASDTAQSYSRESSDEVFNVSTGTIETPEQSLIAGTYAALKVIFKIPNLLSRVLYTTASYLYVPTWIIGIIIAIVLVFISAMLIKLFFKRAT